VVQAAQTRADWFGQARNSWNWKTSDCEHRSLEKIHVGLGDAQGVAALVSDFQAGDKHSQPKEAGKIWKDLERSRSYGGFGAYFVLVAGRCSWFNSKTLLPLLPAAILPLRNALRTPWLQKDGRVNFVQGKATNFNKTIYDYIWIVLGIFPSWRDLESLLLVLLHQRIPRASLLANKYGKAPVMKHLHAPRDKTVVGTLANHINMLLCSPEVEATFKKALKNHC
jgi:hypothetical protein